MMRGDNIHTEKPTIAWLSRKVDVPQPTNKV